MYGASSAVTTIIGTAIMLYELIAVVRINI